MGIRIYNTLSGKKEAFSPLEPGKVRMYVCGPTVYDSCHIGHARSVVIFDVIVRYFRSVGWQTTYVRNFTDIDDKIIRRADELHMDAKSLAEKYILEFYRDMDALNVERATIEPRATEHIDDIIRVIGILMEKGTAYQSGADVYFAVDRFKEYGKLSGRNPEDMLAGARIEIDENKKNPLDFVLWKSAKPGEPKWMSPWGEGRPGWHIECSAMSNRFLDETFDIHGGGKDLIFPHHENEIAQSEAAFGKSFARFWIHNGFVTINKEKMSKSLGNFLMIKDILKSFHPEAVRLFLLSSHYRSPIDFSPLVMEEAAAGLEKIYSALARIEERIGPLFTEQGYDSDGFWKRFSDAMEDDFNTAMGIGVLFEAVRSANRILDENSGPLDPAAGTMLGLMGADILKIGKILGLLSLRPRDYFETQKSAALEEKSLDPAKIEELIAARNTARKDKQWGKADEIRKQLADMNVTIEDRAGETVWKIKNG
jgi:cysteinyl-tRNA synthetase